MEISTELQQYIKDVARQETHEAWYGMLKTISDEMSKSGDSSLVESVKYMEFLIAVLKSLD